MTPYGRMPPEAQHEIALLVEEGVSDLLHWYRCKMAARAHKAEPVRRKAPLWAVIAAYTLFAALCAAFWALVALAVT